MTTTSEPVVDRSEARMLVIGRWLQWALLPVAFVGMGVSAYLSYIHFAGLPVYCEGSGGCHTVQSSEFAKVMGVPVALLGFILYSAIFVCGVLALRGAGRAAEIAPFAVFGLALSGVLYSSYLTWLELYEIYAICAWCVASASILGVLFVLSAAEIAVSGRWRGEVFEYD